MTDDTHRESTVAEPAILVVEDSIDEALLIQTALSKAFPGIPVTIAQDGDQGLQHIQDGVWSLLVLDLNLPGLDGIELTRAAKTFRPGCPVVAVTGYTNAAYHDGAYRAGADMVMTKPLDLAEFVRSARDLIHIEAPEEEEEDASGPTVLAIGARAGDVEMGCGGILLKHRQEGHNVVVAIVGSIGPFEAIASASAAVMGASVLFNPADAEPIEVIQATDWLKTMVAEVKPVIMYVPTEKDREASRLVSQQAAVAAAGGIPKVLSYQGPTATVDFIPKMFVDVGPYLDRKLALVRTFQDYDLANVTQDVALSTSRYWGRFAGPDEVEPLEVIKG